MYGQGEHAVSDKDTQKDSGFFSDAESFTPQVSNIPLEDAAAGRTASIGELVRDASTQVSSLIRSETELAKTEIAGSAKKAGIAAGLLGGAGVILAYSSFFFFFFLAELLDNWMPRWVAFLVVFLIMFVLVVVLAIVAIKFIKGVKKPAATIESVSQLTSVIPGSSSPASSSDDAGMFT
ncbi:phage holin family protein [uncultured Corynebacterium sp.]|uniref:phage holin family protein n=1 Tax=uncultured Corynebacterium sp. TaxID=159447 RepID=UPI0025E1C558|nr:phage holin family protein [uncultured Corynebacterium sp.]